MVYVAVRTYIVLVYVAIISSIVASSIDDRRQFVTLTVHLLVQYDGRDAARRAGPSIHLHAAADTCRLEAYIRHTNVICKVVSASAGRKISNDVLRLGK